MIRARVRCWVRHPLRRRYLDLLCSHCYLTLQRSLTHHPAGRNR